MSGGFTSVDLSRLPVPDVIEQVDFEAILAAMLADLRERDPTFDALVESDPAYKILQVAAYRETLMREQFNTRAQSMLLAYARGSDLDHLGALMGVERYLLSAGNPSLSIPPTYESDTEFRRRIQLAPEGFSVAGPEGAYVFHALSADADVLDASAESPTPGVVVVSVLSRVGNGAASPQLVASVADKLSADDVRPLTDNVTVQSATIVDYSIAATITTYAGPGAAEVIAEAQSRAAAYVAESRRLGRDITRSAIFAALHVDGVHNVTLSQPAADIIVARDEAPNCTGIAITNGGFGE